MTYVLQLPGTLKVHGHNSIETMSFSSNAVIRIDAVVIVTDKCFNELQVSFRRPHSCQNKDRPFTAWRKTLTLFLE